jgi:hypothetical protein
VGIGNNAAILAEDKTGTRATLNPFTRRFGSFREKATKEGILQGVRHAGCHRTRGIDPDDSRANPLDSRRDKVRSLGFRGRGKIRIIRGNQEGSALGGLIRGRCAFLKGGKLLPTNGDTDPTANCE